MINDLLHYHQVERIQHHISCRADCVAFRQWTPAGESQLTWQQVGTRITHIASALLAMNVDVQERVAIFANNSMAWSLADLAILHLRAISVPLYATHTPAQAAFILNDAAVRILFVGDQAQMDAAMALRGDCPGLQHIIVFNDEVDLRGCDIARYLSQVEHEADVANFQPQLTERIASRDLKDLFTLIYTSGTTGEPKGVMLDYCNMAAQLYLHDERLSVNEHDVSLSFLPLSHVFERAWSFFIMHTGAQNVFLPNTDWVREAMVAVQPTVMCAVPRFYEKIFSAVKKRSHVRRCYAGHYSTGRWLVVNVNSCGSEQANH